MHAIDLIRRSSFLLLTSLLCAGVHFAVLPGPPDVFEDPHAIDFNEAQGMDSVIWVDARPEHQFLERSYPGAISLNEDNWASAVENLLLDWQPGQAIVIFCDSRACGASQVLAERMREELGLEEVYWLVGGWEEMPRR